MTWRDGALIAYLPVLAVNPQFSTPIPMQDLRSTLDRFRLRCGCRTRTLASRLGDCPCPIVALHYVARVGLTRHSIPSSFATPYRVHPPMDGFTAVRSSQRNQREKARSTVA